MMQAGDDAHADAAAGAPVTLVEVSLGFAAGGGYLLTGYGVVWMLNGRALLWPRWRQAWVLSMLGAAASVALSLPSWWDMLTHGCRASVMESDSRSSVLLAATFAAFLVLDLVLGMRHYRAHLDWLASWVHHFFYLALVAAALYFSFTRALAIFLIEEIPVFVLALGQVEPRLWSDTLFGVLWVLMRVGLHSVLILQLFRMNGDLYLHLVAFPPLLLHCWWLYLWTTAARVEKRHTS